MSQSNERRAITPAEVAKDVKKIAAELERALNDTSEEAKRPMREMLVELEKGLPPC